MDGNVWIDHIQELSPALHQHEFNLVTPRGSGVGQVDSNALGATASKGRKKLEDNHINQADLNCQQGRQIARSRLFNWAILHQLIFNELKKVDESERRQLF